MRSLLADVARVLALRSKARADAILQDAARRAGKANARAEWWSDAQAWLDGLGSWTELRVQRKRRQMPRAHFQIMGPVV